MQLLLFTVRSRIVIALVFVSAKSDFCYVVLDVLGTLKTTIMKIKLILVIVALGFCFSAFAQ
ncbi:hypothetical protein GCM10027341_36040 [Spirosoma knui]